MKLLDMAMQDLGYDDIWLKTGIASSEFILSQYEDYIARDKTEPIEHFRYSAFSKFVKKHTKFAHETFELLLNVAKHEASLSGPNTFHLAGFTLLKDHPGLTNGQIEKLLQATLNTDVYQKVKQSQRLKLIASGYSNVEFIDDCISNGNSPVVRALLEHCGALKKSHIDTIAISGPSKAIRNLASQRLKTLK